MAINLDKYLDKKISATTSKINLDKYLTPAQKTVASSKAISLPKNTSASKGEIVNRTLPSFLGGGTYTMKGGDSSYNANSGHSTYGGVPTKDFSERADIFPASLSGNNNSDKNIAYEKFLPDVAKKQAKGETLPIIKTATDKYLIENLLPNYKAGKITLRDAQVKAVSFLRNEQEGLNKEMENQDLGGAIGSFADEFVGTAKNIGNWLGKKTGQIAEKVVNKIQGKTTPTLNFKVGAGLNTEKKPMIVGLPKGVQGPNEKVMLSDQDLAKMTIDNNIAKSAEEQANPLNPKNPAELLKNKIVDQAQKGLPNYQKAIAKEQIPVVEAKKKAVADEQAYNKTLTPQQLTQKTDPLFVDMAKNASETLGYEVKPENYVDVYNKLPQEQKNLIDAKGEEKATEKLAQITTAPIRFTLGAIARDYAMTEDELKGANEKFIPQSDIEKLIYGDESIQAISKSDDLYGIIAKNVGVPAAIGAMVFLDLDILNPTGLVKKAIEEKVAKQGIDIVSKMGSDEYIKMIDDIIQNEVKLGKITEEQVVEATAKAQKNIQEIKDGKPVEIVSESKTPNSNLLDNTLAKEKTAKPPVKSKIVTGEAKTVKLAETAPNTKTVKNEPFTNVPKSDTVDVKKLSKKALDLTKKNDGVTISLKGDIPVTGYVYAPKKTTEKIVHQNEFSAKHIEDYIREHYDDLSVEGNHFGNWKDGDNFVMDVSRVETDAKKAASGAKVADQDGIFNLDTFETINRQDYEKLIDNAKAKNTRLPRKADVQGGTDKGLSGKSKESTSIKGVKSKVELPKKQPIKYVPIEKGPDLRKKIVTKSTLGKASVPKRIQKDAIEKGLIDAYKNIPEYDKMNMKEQASNVAKLINEDPERAVRIALGQELTKATDGATPESVLIAVKNQALEDGNTDLVVRLAQEEGGVAKESTYLGQRIKSLDEGANQDDAFYNIRKVVKQRTQNLESKTGKKTSELVKKEVEKINKEIAKAKPKADEWLEFVNSIQC